MDKPQTLRWKKVNTPNSKSSNQPIPRWGHTCCVIQDQVIFFGGYADSNYMNDIWSFNYTTMEWNQIKTTGDIPLNRSNCTMNYDSENNRIIIFGGGGPNKKRFNSISILDWKTKEWFEIKPRQNQSSPWERTYHSAQFKFPYLIVYGGEGLADLDDVWIFNFITLSWKEVIIPKNKIKPCARRFHSSAIIKNQFFIIGGCHSRYRSLNDVYSLDLTPLFQNQDYSKLQWKQRKLQGATFLTRWGHTSNVHSDKIYVFGGRFSNDLNDLLVIDFQTNTIKAVKGVLDAPIARRRHCSAFIGSSLMIFGGFNGEYFNDLNYITLQQPKNLIIKSEYLQRVAGMVNQARYSDMQIITNKGSKIYLNEYLISQALENSKQRINDFFSYIISLSDNQILRILRFMYSGVGQYQKQLEERFSLKSAYYLDGNKKYDYRTYFNMMKRKLDGKKNQLNNFMMNDGSAFLKLKQNQWQKLFKIGYLVESTHYYLDCCFNLDNGQNILMNSHILKLHSQYFKCLLSGQFLDFKQGKRNNIRIMDISVKVFKIILKYIQFDILVIPDTLTQLQWLQLIKYSKYYDLKRLVNICQHQISINIQNQLIDNSQVLYIAAKENFQNLKNFCAQYQIRKLQQSKRLITPPLKPLSITNIPQNNNQKKQIITNILPKTTNLSFGDLDKLVGKNRIQQQILNLKRKYFKLLYFQIQQITIENSKIIPYMKLQGNKQNNYNSYEEQSQKENTQINS